MLNHFFEVQSAFIGKGTRMTHMLTVIAHVTQGNETTEFLYVERVIILPDFVTVEGNILCSANTAAIAVLSVDLFA